MYLGQLVETASRDALFSRATLHPALLAAVPTLEPQRTRRGGTRRDPDPANPPPGCRFSSRCPRLTTAVAAKSRAA
jgi:peptide/nickel transport system ATP-binding protein